MACIEEERKRTIGEKKRVAQACARILGRQQVIYRNRLGTYAICSIEEYKPEKGQRIEIVDVPDDAAK